MFLASWWWVIVLCADFVLRLFLMGRVILRRTPVPYTLAWMVLLFFVPILGPIVYVLIGEPKLGSRRLKKYEFMTKSIEERALVFWRERGLEWSDAQDDLAPLATLGLNLSGLPSFQGNRVELLGDSQHFLDRLIADIDLAEHHCHLLYYIWEPDEKGEKVCGALLRAALRGVACRVIVDSAGSDALLESGWWTKMKDAGVNLAEALPVNTFRMLFERVDLRNHRKIAVFDGNIGYCGSQNLTVQNFVKMPGVRAGPWLDATVRVEGPAVHGLQITFLRDWVMDSDEAVPDCTKFLGEVDAKGASIVHVVPSGPGPKSHIIHQAFLAMLYTAKKTLTLTTPYFVPDEATKSALQNAALRGVSVTLIVPKKSDNMFVDAAARSHFEDLLESGVKVLLHGEGLLHAKTALVDGLLSKVGSANFDMRSFWLNFEATLFIADRSFADQLRVLHESYIAKSTALDAAAWKKRSLFARFRDNSAQLLGPLL